MTIDFASLAREMADELVEMRRYLHQNAEVGDQLPKTAAYIKKKLTEFGCAFEEMCGHGVVCNIGSSQGDSKTKTILIRADIDALPQTESSGEPFACTTGAAHSCGHDIHTAALLGCAKMLHAHRDALCGNVKLVFQPDEERIKGAIDMIEAGVLENPHVDAAFAMHTNLPLKAGAFNVLPGTYLSSSDLFRIEVRGSGAHSSAPDKGIDPILIAAKIIDAALALPAREVDALTPIIVTFGTIHAGSAANIIPDTAELTGSIRAFDRDVRDFTKRRFVELVETTAQAYRATATVEFTSATPTTYNDPALTGDIVGWLRELTGADNVFCQNLKVKGSDDFAYYAERVPSVMYHVGMGTAADGYTVGLHNPAVRFDESALPNAAAAFAHIAVHWLAAQV